MSNPISARTPVTVGSATVHTAQERALAAEHWLLSAAPKAKAARTEWAKFGLAVLRCGGIFTAVRIHADVVYAAAGTDDPADVGDYLTHVLRGPVFADQGSRRFYALVPASTSRLPVWQGNTVPDVECLGGNSFLGVPRPGRNDPREARCHWVVPMDGPGDLCSPHAVTQLIDYGRFKRAAAERADNE
ncbi:hypothetical protein [Streptomyces sp. NBC_00401]|uniref:hypothetical protein n=1 Tax=Streptomyces sp. NBC_00401 TaxID=2975738 RepID=UPI00224E2C81|nr:hypothetical protein [Streptomyces sp. NBC_00401]MCX5083711.1 hypothetical protein [Streptomyces sp. NBC_00401]